MGRKMAIGWRVCSFFAVAQVFKYAFNYNAAQSYNPLIGAYLRKYHNSAAGDAFEIQDRKREFYQIDTSQYMNYGKEDLGDMHMHANHGPQPDGEAMDSSWLSELDNFLNCQPNHLA